MDNLTASNPRAHAVRLYYTGSNTIYEGMPVCYEFDTTTNWFGGSVSNGEVTASTTTAEGSHNEGKYIRVQDVDADNSGSFAGVVKKGGWVGKDGPRVLDVYVPNGAVVPVRSGVSSTVGITPLCITNGVQDFDSFGRPVAIAMETVDRSSTSGLCLAELCPWKFIYQIGDAQALSFDDQSATETIIVNRIQLTQAQTAGSFVPLYVHHTHTGNTSAACNGYSVLAYTNYNGTYDQTCYNRVILGQCNISGTSNGANVHFAGITGQLSGSPTFTTCSHAAAIWGDSSLTVAPTTGNLEILRLTNNGAARCDQMVYMYGNSGASSGGADYIWRFDSLYFGGAVNTPIRDGGTGDTTIDTGGDWKKIRINIGGTAYWLVAMTNPSET